MSSEQLCVIYSSRRYKGEIMVVEELFKAILQFDESRVTTLTKQALSEGIAIDTILNDGLIAAMDTVGERFSNGDLFVPEMLMAAQAMKGGMNILKPLLAGDSAAAKGTVVIGTVKGDLHDIGKNLVAMMMEGAGFNVIDLGVDVAPEAFIGAARENKAGVIALSALLTTTMPAMAETVDAIKQSGLSLATIVGGAPVSPEFAEKIKADGYGADAPGAVVLLRRFTQKTVAAE